MDASDMPPTPVVLASTSRYRRELLARLLTGFSCVSPEVDETPAPGEAPAALASRLAAAKARAGASLAPGALVIGSDQVAALAGRTLAKPGGLERAKAQLRDCSGRTLELFTAVCLCGPGPDDVLEHVDHVRVRFRKLDDEEIRRYLERERPYDCAGSFKVEGLGIALMEHIDSRDPTAIQGLPLMWVADALRRRGLHLP